MRYPEFIKKGDTIGFVAPAFGCTFEPYQSRFNNALNIFKQNGFDVEVGPNCFKCDGVGISTKPEDCGREINEYYPAGSNKALISCGGGELMCETASFIDFEALAKAEPKWYMGYSDNTHMTFLLTTLCDTASIYGPNAPAFGREPWHKSMKDSLAILTGENLTVSNYDKWEIESAPEEAGILAPFNCTEDSVVSAMKPDGKGGMVKTDSLEMTGRLIGGCLDCLVGMTGTRFDKVTEFAERYKEDGFIWFLECCDLNVFSMRRAMWQLYEAGWFKYCKGIMFGRPMHFDEPMFGLDRFEAVLEVVRKLQVPVILDADIGHLAPSMPLICGSVGEVSFAEEKLNIRMNLK